MIQREEVWRRRTMSGMNESVDEWTMDKEAVKGKENKREC